MEISLRTTGDSVVIENFRRLEKQAGDMSPAFSRIADLLKKSHESNFKMQGAQFGSKWSARKQSYSWPILRKTGTLSNSFKSSHDSKSATIKNTALYAKWHQGGTRRMPARPVVGWADKDLNEIVRILRREVLEV